MRDNMERRFVFLPFSLGHSCFSQTSLAVRSNQLKTQTAGSSTALTTTRRQDSSVVRMKNSVGFLQRLIRSFKGFSRLFGYKEKMQFEMEIGLPTDVKHVTHIGLDGTTTTNPVQGWEDLNKAPEILAFPKISLRQFEHAMAAQADTDSPIHDLVDFSKHC